MPELTPKQARWVIEVDLAKANLQTVRDVNRRQRILVREYRLKREQEAVSAMPARALSEPWKQFEEAIRSKTTHTQAFHDYIDEQCLLDGAILRLQISLVKETDKIIERGCSRPLAERMAQEMGLSSAVSSSGFDSRDVGSYTIALAPLPYGPCIDDAGKRVEHWILWSSRDFYLKEHWESESDYIQHKKDGIGGILGFDELENARQHGYTGHPASLEIEKAVMKRFPIEDYRVLWFINARKFQSIPTLPHAHIWAARKDACGACLPGVQVVPLTDGQTVSQASVHEV